VIAPAASSKLISFAPSTWRLEIEDDLVDEEDDDFRLRSEFLEVEEAISFVDVISAKSRAANQNEYREDDRIIPGSVIFHTLESGLNVCSTVYDLGF
jgi:hypothetical protein